MKTNQIMKREFYQTTVSQRTQDQYFNATDLLKYYNQSADKKKVIAEFWSNQGVQDFMQALANDLNVNVGKSLYLKSDLFTSKRGKVDGGTYMHPYLFVKFAMWLSPEFEVQVIKWVYDNLIDFRNKAGDHYKEMCRQLQQTYIEVKGTRPDPLIFRKEATFINQLVFGDGRDRTRNEATEKELEKLNKIQLANIKLLQNKVHNRHEQLRNFADLL